MSSLPARIGRHRQRYEDEFRLVAGCIPYRLKKDIEDNTDSLKNIEVLMISSPNRDDLVFPKGGWENDESDREAACREALEEAGVKGILDENPLGVWKFRSKSSQNSCSPKATCKGIMFALEVTEECGAWAEDDSRKRIWLNIADAFSRCRYEWMQDALEKFRIAMSGDENCQSREESVGPSTLPVQILLAEQQISPTSTFYENSSMQSFAGIDNFSMQSEELRHPTENEFSSTSSFGDSTMLWLDDVHNHPMLESIGTPTLPIEDLSTEEHHQMLSAISLDKNSNTQWFDDMFDSHNSLEEPLGPPTLPVEDFSPELHISSTTTCFDDNSNNMQLFGSTYNSSSIQREESVGPPTLPVQDLSTEHQISSTSCYISNSSTPRFDGPYNIICAPGAN